MTSEVDWNLREGNSSGAVSQSLWFFDCHRPCFLLFTQFSVRSPRGLRSVVRPMTDSFIRAMNAFVFGWRMREHDERFNCDWYCWTLESYVIEDDMRFWKSELEQGRFMSEWAWQVATGGAAEERTGGGLTLEIWGRMRMGRKMTFEQEMTTLQNGRFHGGRFERIAGKAGPCGVISLKRKKSEPRRKH